MSRAIHSLARRIFVAGGLLGTSLIVPASAEAQTIAPERAFLNSALATPQVASPASFWAPSLGSALTGAEEATRALLGRTGTDAATHDGDPTSLAFEGDPRPANQERALLGKWTEQ